MGFGAHMQALRKAAGLSQIQLANRSGLPIDNVRNWEQGRATPRIDSAAKLAAALGVSLDELAKGVSEGSEEEQAEPEPPAKPKPKKRKPRP